MLKCIICFFLSVCLFASDLIQGRSSHASVLLGEYMWVFGGYSFNTEPFDDLIRYSLNHIPCFVVDLFVCFSFFLMEWAQSSLAQIIQNMYTTLYVLCCVLSNVASLHCTNKLLFDCWNDTCLVCNILL